MTTAAFAEEPVAEPTAKTMAAPPRPPHLLIVPDLSGFAELRIWAECYEDAQRARIACANRMERGGLPPDVFATQLATLKDAEHELGLGMRRCYRRVVPAGVREWQRSTFGIGEHLLARLLGVLGHPRIATPFHWEGEGSDRVLVADEMFERTVRQLWTYCGHGEALRRRKGMTAEEAFGLGSPRAKMLVHLLAEASIKCRVEPTATSETRTRSADPTSSPAPPIAGAPASADSAAQDPSPDASKSSPQAKPVAARRDPSADQPELEPNAKAPTADRRYRHVYEERRAHTAQTHPEWTPGHSHNDALRVVGKEILRDLWRAAE